MSTKPGNNGYVLDSVTVMTWLKDTEPVSTAISKILSSDEHVSMSAITVGEIISTLEKHFSSAHTALFLARLPNLPIEIVTPGFQDIVEAAGLKARHSIAHADSFAAQLALKKGAALVTGDPGLRAIPELSVIWPES